MDQKLKTALPQLTLESLHELDRGKLNRQFTRAIGRALSNISESLLARLQCGATGFEQSARVGHDHRHLDQEALRLAFDHLPSALARLPSSERAGTRLSSAVFTVATAVAGQSARAC